MSESKLETTAVLSSDASSMTPKQIVAELDRYIVGQAAAKRAVAIALRNRWRRKKLDPAIQEEVAPKNILMIGPTGVGKTEIARRLATLAGAPFIKVEATRYTEVGYHGRDVESIIRDLVKQSINMAQTKAQSDVRAKAAEAAEERLLDLLLPAPSSWTGRDKSSKSAEKSENGKEDGSAAELHEKTRNKLRKKLRDGSLDAREVEFDVSVSGDAMASVFAPSMGEEMGAELQDALSKMMPKKTKRRKMSVAEARRILEGEEAERLIDQDAVTKQAIDAAENLGIVFIDEIDKVAGGRGGSGPDVSREGVQRDLLPIVEGSSVNSRWGLIKTDHILFVAAGAFHMSKPSDLLPELQGRFPIRVELQDLTEEDFRRILTTPRNALTRQYEALLSTENVELEFTPDAIAAMARIAATADARSQNIGARRLHTVMEKVLEDISFDAAGQQGEARRTIVVDAKLVEERLKPIMADEDLAKYIL